MGLTRMTCQAREPAIAVFKHIHVKAAVAQIANDLIGSEEQSHSHQKQQDPEDRFVQPF